MFQGRRLFAGVCAVFGCRRVEFGASARLCLACALFEASPFELRCLGLTGLVLAVFLFGRGKTRETCLQGKVCSISSPTLRGGVAHVATFYSLLLGFRRDFQAFPQALKHFGTWYRRQRHCCRRKPSKSERPNPESLTPLD